MSFHQAYIEVNEEGTEAAAATAVVIKYRCLLRQKTPVFRADRPFIFMITDDETGLHPLHGESERSGRELAHCPFEHGRKKTLLFRIKRGFISSSAIIQ